MDINLSIADYMEPIGDSKELNFTLKSEYFSSLEYQKSYMVENVYIIYDRKIYQIWNYVKKTREKPSLVSLRKVEPLPWGNITITAYQYNPDTVVIKIDDDNPDRLMLAQEPGLLVGYYFTYKHDPHPFECMILTALWDRTDIRGPDRIEMMFVKVPNPDQLFGSFHT